MTESRKLEYPPIAKAAHVTGVYIFLARFKTDGNIESVRFISGPLGLQPLMQKVGTEYIQGLRANPFSGPRECPIILEFAMGGISEEPKTTVSHIDPQHTRIVSEQRPPKINYAIASK